jgi:hypothetical protein
MPRAQIKDEKMYQKLRDEGEGKNKYRRYLRLAPVNGRWVTRPENGVLERG